MRWPRLASTLKMFGKTIRPMRTIYSRIAKILGHRAPEQYVYELSWTRREREDFQVQGNGISVERVARLCAGREPALFSSRSARSSPKETLILM